MPLLITPTKHTSAQVLTRPSYKGYIGSGSIHHSYQGYPAQAVTITPTGDYAAQATILTSTEDLTTQAQSIIPILQTQRLRPSPITPTTRLQFHRHFPFLLPRLQRVRRHLSQPRIYRLRPHSSLLERIQRFRPSPITPTEDTVANASHITPSNDSAAQATILYSY